MVETSVEAVKEIVASALKEELKRIEDSQDPHKSPSKKKSETKMEALEGEVQVTITCQVTVTENHVNSQNKEEKDDKKDKMEEDNEEVQK